MYSHIPRTWGKEVLTHLPALVVKNLYINWIARSMATSAGCKPVASRQTWFDSKAIHQLKYIRSIFWVLRNLSCVLTLLWLKWMCLENEQHWRLQRIVNPSPHGTLGSIPRFSTRFCWFSGTCAGRHGNGGAQALRSAHTVSETQAEISESMFYSSTG